MIISASRRTDIPAVFSEWFFNRIKEGYVIVPNPMNTKQLSKISLDPSVVDCIVFWTKNPIPMMDRLDELEKYDNRFYFTFTLNAYCLDAEPNIPNKGNELIPAFQQLSRTIGKERVCWRYDPIFISDNYDIRYHKKYFSVLCDKLASFTEKCTVSFVDLYEKTKRNTAPLNCRAPHPEEERELLAYMVSVGKEHGIYIDTCCEKTDYSDLGVMKAHCIDKERIERISGRKISVKKDKNQRLECGCMSSIDIGTYDTCSNGCLYCYANACHAFVQKNIAKHDPTSPLLIGNKDDYPKAKITDREMKSLFEEKEENYLLDF